MDSRFRGNDEGTSRPVIPTMRRHSCQGRLGGRRSGRASDATIRTRRGVARWDPVQVGVRPIRCCNLRNGLRETWG